VVCLWDSPTCEWFVGQGITLEECDVVESISENACGEETGHPRTDHDGVFSDRRNLPVLVSWDGPERHDDRSTSSTRSNVLALMRGVQDRSPWKRGFVRSPSIVVARAGRSGPAVGSVTDITGR
jgi:hypothetical protein